MDCPTTSTREKKEKTWSNRFMDRLLAPVSGGQPPSANRNRLRRGAQGQALVEFALTLPFLILLFVVLVELGLLIRSHMTVTAAVREGTRLVSASGNAEPSVSVNSSGQVVGGNDVNGRVGFDADLVLVQNTNTALQQERQSVTLLMTYRADVTEIDATSGRPTDPVTGLPVATQIGKHGIGGAYGVYYNPDISLMPFQEIFDYVTKTNSSGQVEKWFMPRVMSTARCAQVYGTSDPAKPSQGTPAGNSYSGAAFCGDASNTNGSNGITRTVQLGQINKNTNANNAQQIYSKARYSGGATCTAQSDGSVIYSSAIQCWRYNFAPWYPSLRRAQDVGLSPNTNPATLGYQNYQGETAAQFGIDNPSGGNRSADYVGVRINYTHNWFLSFFPGNISLSDKSVKIMEPVGGNFQQPGS